jgi:hypothetical protein
MLLTTQDLCYVWEGEVNFSVSAGTCGKESYTLLEICILLGYYAVSKGQVLPLCAAELTRRAQISSTSRRKPEVTDRRYLIPRRETSTCIVLCARSVKGCIFSIGIKKKILMSFISVFFYFPGLYTIVKGGGEKNRNFFRLVGYKNKDEDIITTFRCG